MKIWNIILSALVVLSAAAAAVGICYGLRANQEINSLRYEFEHMDDTKENDVVIGDFYTIKATTAISDAYKAGKTDQLDANQKKTLEEAKEVLDEIIKDGMTPFEQEKAVYEWMTKNIKADSEVTTLIQESPQDRAEPGKVLESKKAVCVGFATTFRLFMEMLDIPCKVVHDTGRSHSWDLVQLDGNWYHTDIYSDSGTPSYSYFNRNDAMMSDNSWDTSFYPAATSLDYNVAYMERQKLDDIYEIPVKVYKALKNKKSLVSFEFKKLNKREKAVVDELGSQIQYVLNAKKKYENYTVSTTQHETESGVLVWCSMYEIEPEEEEYPSINKKEAKAIEKAIKKAFGKDTVVDVYFEGEDESGNTETEG
ncbi:MAG: hypothetical protein K6G62_03315 [Eubacterium sp.]|nr:hypothetical protein [Eubacterium sp.]